MRAVRAKRPRRPVHHVLAVGPVQTRIKSLLLPRIISLIFPMIRPPVRTLPVHIKWGPDLPENSRIRPENQCIIFQYCELLLEGFSNSILADFERLHLGGIFPA